jgi:polysaccharide pyruvyl transferase WcaK-like protein
LIKKIFQKIDRARRNIHKLSITHRKKADQNHPLRIRIIGWYGFDSTGDDLMQWCIERLFQERARKFGINIEFTDDTCCDLCVIGGGTIIGCDTSQICSRVEKIDAPLAIFGPGFRNTGERECRKWRPKMRALFERSFQSGVRGPGTVEALKHYKMADDVDVIGDAAVGFEPIPLPWQPSAPHVGVVVRAMKNAAAGYEERYASQKKTFENLATIIPIVLDRLSAQPLFLSFAENEFDSDSEAARELRAMLPAQYHDAPILPYCDDVRLNPSIVSQLDYLISERMHPAIIAWLAAKPCVMLENQYGKSTDFMAGIDMEHYCLRTDALDTDRYMARFDDIMAHREEIAAASAKSFDLFRQRQNMFIDTALRSIFEE